MRAERYSVKRHLAGLAGGTALALALTGCGKGSASDSGGSDGKTIRFVAAKYDDDTQAYWTALIKDFEKANPGYRVNLEVVDWEQMDSKVKTYVQTKQEPDILNYNKFSDFARDGLVHKAQDVVSPKVLADFLPLFRQKAQYNGAQYGLPFISSARLFFYNKDIFAKAGIAKPPSTWAEVEADAKKIKQAGYIGLGLPLGPEEAQAEFQIWAMNNGGGWTDASGKWTIDQQANVDTLSYLRKLTKEKVTQPNPEATNRKDVFNQFAQGKIGMLNGAVFMRKGFIDPVDAKLNYGVAALPSKDGSTHKTLGVQDYLVAFKKSDGSNKAAVKKFLDFFYQKDNAAKFVSTEGFLSVTESAGQVLSSDSQNAAYYKPFVDALSSAEFAPADDPAWAAVDGAVKQRIGTGVAGGDPAKVLGEIQKTAQKGD
ncbi:extracellular solute-binding protein [Streptomyces sp. Root369]|uniref:extracellular solute-binding protein n=1 Tax=Streptomyces sp. Root369 TaxID=1736523 RepID=UPI000B02B569|nr:extracellular solute-binding protein [Streptomyces sp. Root369]